MSDVPSMTRWPRIVWHEASASSSAFEVTTAASHTPRVGAAGAAPAGAEPSR